MHLTDTAAAFWMQPLFNEDVNAHPFRYINNIETQNEQENLNFSLKWDTSLDIGDLSLSFSYNDQENFLLADGSSAAFNLYLSEPGCQASYKRSRKITTCCPRRSSIPTPVPVMAAPAFSRHSVRPPVMAISISHAISRTTTWNCA